MVNPITGELVNTESNKSKIFYYLKGTEPTYTNNRDLETVFRENNNNNDDNSE